METLLRGCSVAVLIAASGCAVQSTGIRPPEARTSVPDTRLANLQRAARYPWRDDGRCAVQEAGGTWAVLVERCYDALDRSRLRFTNNVGLCPIAQAAAINADAMVRMVGICLLVQPELVVGAVVVVGLVIVAAAMGRSPPRLKPDQFR